MEESPVLDEEIDQPELLREPSINDEKWAHIPSHHIDKPIWRTNRRGRGAKMGWVPSSYSKGLPKKKSFGIACCRYNRATDDLEILMVKKRCSFWFIEFVMGHYKFNMKNLLYLFTRMTNDEKLEIVKMDFSKMWYRAWLKNGNEALFNACRQKFNENFPNSSRLERLISQTKSYDSLWEIPKGKKNGTQETDLNCAIRELQEETNISADLYTFVELDAKIMRYSNMKVQYIYKYFIALLDNYESGKYAVPRELEEIIDVKWMKIDQIKMFDQTKKIAPFIQLIFDGMRKKYKIRRMMCYD